MSATKVPDTTRPWDQLHIPQTNVQLYRLLTDLGYSQDDLSLVRRVYDFGAKAFATRMQGCGKPFVTHGLGTAGILAYLGAHPNLVAAAIIHNGYRNADLGGIPPTQHHRARQVVLEAVGPDVEKYLDRFWTMKPGRFRGSAEDLPALDRELLLLHSAETLEKMADAAIAYWDIDHEEFLANAGSRIPIARSLNQPELAEWLAQAIAAVRSEQAPPTLHNRPSSYVVLPPSVKQRPLMAVRRYLWTLIRSTRITAGRWTRRLGLRR